MPVDPLNAPGKYKIENKYGVHSLIISRYDTNTTQLCGVKNILTHHTNKKLVVDLNRIEDDVICTNSRVQAFKSVDNQPQFFDNVPFLQFVLLILSNTVV